MSEILNVSAILKLVWTDFPGVLTTTSGNEACFDQFATRMLWMRQVGGSFLIAYLRFFRFHRVRCCPEYLPHRTHTNRHVNRKCTEKLIVTSAWIIYDYDV